MSCLTTQIIRSEQAMEEEKRAFSTSLSSSVLCFLLLLICNTQAINAASTSRQSDHLALMAFRLSIKEDPSGILRSWNESVSVCNWEGITCSQRHGRVTSLDLGSRGLVGSLSPSIGNMSFLRLISLANNSFQGEIPPELGRLIRLEVLNLSSNSFEGQIPTNLSYCSNLVALSVGWNKLEGKIPAELGSLSRLRHLSVSFSQFTGEIPPVIGNLSLLETLSLSRNDFQGKIPASLGRLKNLTILALGGNRLTGTIPRSIYNLTSITGFSVASNQLHGTVPSDIGLILPNLQIFEMWGNYFTGSIPTSLSNASKIESLDMGQNNLTGKIAVDFWNLQQLNYLNFMDNSLGRGDEDELNFINSLTNCSKLEHLFVSGNHLNGVLPASVANLSIQLKTLAIDGNQIYGALPPELVRLGSLNALVVEENYLTGPIPADIGRLQNLQVLRLTNNRFSGEIPSSIGNLSWLSRVFLDGNELNGSIPSSFGDCHNLLVLSLSYNYLSGLIPKELFVIPSLAIGLNLQNNLLVGSLPPEIGSATKLANFFVSKNNLSGEIPGNIEKCTSLESLYMNGNSFQGDIPPSLASLRALRNLDLSGNNLSGKIPNFLESFSLEYLNLSSNNFEGEVPVKGAFGNTSAVSVEGNNKLCGGILELKLPRCPSGGSKESKRGKGRLVKTLTISISSAILGVAMICSFLYYWFKKRTRNQSSESLRKEVVRKVSYETLRKATDGFSPANLVGIGAFGSVYRGILSEDGEAVAVKVLNLKERGASKSFAAECEALRNTRHRNLVKVITCCSSIDFQGNEFKALVYEFLPNGSFEKWLHPVDIERIQLRNLNFIQRMNIAIDVASALDYLHHHCHEPIIHCDIKPSNILLDSDMNARVGDFGLARFLPQIAKLNESSSIAVRGTIGYTPPEYGLGNELSTKGDVYSYGILLLEMITGKKPTDDGLEKVGNLHNLASMALPDQVLEVLDPVLLNEDEETADSENLREMQTSYDQKFKCLASMVKIGVQCSKESPQDRPDISDVLSELQMIRDTPVRN